MPNTDPLLRVVLEYATTSRWEDARDMLARIPEQMLSDKAAQYLHAMVLSHRVLASTNSASGTLTEEREAFLQRARTIGVAAAWAERQTPKMNTAALIDLPQMVSDWLKSASFAEQRAFLAEHPVLLEPRVDNIMNALLRQFVGPPEDLRFIQASAIWLQRARRNGLDAGWEAFCQEMDLSANASSESEIEWQMQLLLEWLNTGTYDEQRAFLEAQPALLDPSFERLMDVLLDQFAGQREATFLHASQIWLQQARANGYEAGWQAFLKALTLDSRSPAMGA